MNIIIVYRVENKYGIGPYKSYLCGAQEYLRCHNLSLDTHPPIWRDTGIYSDDYYCGFSNHQQLLDWFKSKLGMLHSHGFKVSSYAVPSTSVVLGKSGRQLAFIKDDATLVCRMNILSFVKMFRSYNSNVEVLAGQLQD